MQKKPAEECWLATGSRTWVVAKSCGTMSPQYVATQCRPGPGWDLGLWWALNEPSQHQPRMILPRVVAAISPFPWPGHLPWAVGGYVCLGGFVSSSRSSSWLCLFQTVKTLKISGTGHGIPASLRPFGHAVCMHVTCVLAYQSLHGVWTQGKGLTASCPLLNGGAELSCIHPIPSS